MLANLIISGNEDVKLLFLPIQLQKTELIFVYLLHRPFGIPWTGDGCHTNNISELVISFISSKPPHIII